MKRWMAAGLVAAWAAPAAAALPSLPAREVQVLLAADSGDTAWLLTATLALAASVFAARRGAGTRLLIGLAALLAVAWLLVGYSLAFAPGSGWIGGTGALALGGLADVRVDTAVPESAFALWEYAVVLFAAATAMSACASRARGAWLFGFATLWLMLTWVPVAHWLRSDGWLAVRGVLDTGGGVSVHLVAGITALVLTRFVREPRHVPALGGWPLPALAGTLALVAGSALAASDDASTMLLSVLAGAAAGGLVWLAAGLGLTEETAPDPAVGALGGAVAVSAGAGAMGLVAALALGALAAGAMLFAGRLLPRPTTGLMVALVHGGGALLGALAAPLLVVPALGGPGYVEGGPGLAYSVGAQAIALLVTAVWTAVAGAIAAVMMSAVVAPTLTRREAEAITLLSESDRRVGAPSA